MDSTAKNDRSLSRPMAGNQTAASDNNDLHESGRPYPRLATDGSQEGVAMLGIGRRGFACLSLFPVRP